ncbi:MAG TPA: tail fiber domain-containing protein, partial [Bacteroidia bacterium]|nr:tail fiber domain-containing protein [Bacteroidia bacterium]
DYNTAFGTLALYENTTGSYHTAVGRRALENTTVSSGNTSLGYAAGYSFDNGSNNTFIGYDADANAAGYTNSTAVGRNAIVTASNQARIGNASVTSIGGYAPWTDLSDARFKKNVKEEVHGLDFILRLRPVTYNLDAWKLAGESKEDQARDEDGNVTMKQPDEQTAKARNEKSAIVYTGFIAQEVEQAAQQIGYNFSGVDAPKNDKDFYGLRYSQFVVPLVKAVQEQHKMIEQQQQQIAELKKEIATLKNK